MLNNKIYRLSLISLLITLVFQVHSQDQSLVWSIKGNGSAGKSYLIASMPLQDSTFYNYPKKTWSYLSKVDVLVYQKQDKSVYTNFESHSSQLPTEYMVSFVSNQQKPVIPFKNGFTPKPSILPTSQKKELSSAFDIAQLQQIEEIHTSNYAQHKEFTEQKYALLEEIDRALQMQPMAFIVDVANVTGQNGLPALLQAKGYKVKAEEEDYFIKKQEEKLLAIELPSVTPQPGIAPAEPIITNTPTVSNPNPAPSSAVDINTLSIPMSLYNLSQWGTYHLESINLDYQAPNRLKTENQSTYITKTKHLIYSIEVKSPVELNNNLYQQLAVQAGGQINKTNSLSEYPFPASELELMFTENQLAYYRVIKHPYHTVVISVRGDAPHIFSLEATHFLHSIQFSPPSNVAYPGVSNPHITDPKDLPNNTNGSGTPQNPTNNSQQENAGAWVSQTIKNTTFYLPRTPTKVNTNISTGKMDSYVIPRGMADENVYVLSSSSIVEKNIFKLFQQSITDASNEVRGIIEQSDVMPPSKPNTAEYILRDAVGNYYRILYATDQQYFYQFIIMGNKKSINNSTTQQILQSSFLFSK